MTQERHLLKIKILKTILFVTVKSREGKFYSPKSMTTEKDFIKNYK